MKKNKYAHLAKISHDEYHRWRSCERKRRYASPSEVRLGRLDKLYRCSWCDGYHVTRFKVSAAGRQAHGQEAQDGQQDGQVAQRREQDS